MKHLGAGVALWIAMVSAGVACAPAGGGGTPGGSGGSSSSGGSNGSGGGSPSGSGGSTSSGGANGTASGGSPSSSGGSNASGGSSSSSGGSSGSGGSSSSSGGASASGGSSSSSGGSSASGGSSSSSGGASASGGSSSSSGGSSASGGSSSASGGSSGSGGTPGSGGSSSTGSGCPGVAIAPDNMGLVSTSSNSLGIHGSWFEYSDCADLGGKNCSTVTTPPAASFPNTGGKLCTSGQTSMASGAWGAGIALELNDGPPQRPYDTTAHAVKGFCFQLSGTTIPSTSIRVAFPTKNNNDNAYFSAITTTGQHTVLFSDTAQGSWVTTKSAFEPTMVMLVQFQIPASTTATVPWDFCVEGFTAITE
jgi:hypothetical protein